ncbi:DEAD/DEAH box helicase [Desertibaculum subflavum]|uniref:DEAD/DEAH box helicase n=1 Tax=Desertibaculum subflavum TaxID=2268458 RepID=UPI0034D1C709
MTDSPQITGAQFSDLGLCQPLLKALTQEGYVTPTPIQSQAIPHILAGRDMLGTAQTGTGKTAAFALPILHRLAADRRQAPRKGSRVLVLSPTRELALQIAESFRTYGRHLGLSVAVVFGGVGAGPQIQALARGVDILVATPGRLLDHLQAGFARLDQVETFVLDEADQMLDMGFIPAIRRIVKTLPAQRLNLFFSATMPPEIGKLAGELLNRPERVSVAPAAAAADRVAQHVVHVSGADKRARLTQLLRDGGYGRTLVFARTKHGADKIVKGLEQAGIRAVAIHGNKSQSQRVQALDGFKSGKTPILVATDIAARGIDVDNVTHVINFDLPHVAESYVHRIGRTARAGAEGVAISLVAPDERPLLRAIERLIRQTVPVMGELPPLPQLPPQPHEPRQRQDGRPQQRNGKPHHAHGHSGRGHQRPEGRHGGAHHNGESRPQRPAQPAPAGDGEIRNVSFMRPQENRAPHQPHLPAGAPKRHRRPHRGQGPRRQQAAG